MTRDEIIERLSDKFKLIRVEKDYTQDKMAEILGLSKKTLVQIEKARCKPGWTAVVALCALFRDSEILSNQLGDAPLEILSIVAHQKYERPKETTLGGKVWWKVVTEKKGFKVQQNILSHHYRIIDEKDRRWCSSFEKDYILKRLKELTGGESK